MYGCEYFAQDTFVTVLILEPMCTHAFCTQSVPDDDDTKQREKVCVQQVVLCAPPVAHMAVTTVWARNDKKRPFHSVVIALSSITTCVLSTHRHSNTIWHFLTTNCNSRMQKNWHLRMTGLQQNASFQFSDYQISRFSNSGSRASVRCLSSFGMYFTF